MCSFVLFHLATSALKLIAPRDFVFAYRDILFIRLSPRWHQRGEACSADREASHFPWDSILHIHVTGISPIKVLWRLSPPLTFNSCNFWILHYSAPRSNLDRDLAFSFALKCVWDASLQGYNGLDFKRKNTEKCTEKAASSWLNIEHYVYLLYNEGMLRWTQSISGKYNQPSKLDPPEWHRAVTYCHFFHDLWGDLCRFTLSDYKQEHKDIKGGVGRWGKKQQ